MAKEEKLRLTEMVRVLSPTGEAVGQTRELIEGVMALAFEDAREFPDLTFEEWLKGIAE